MTSLNEWIDTKIRDGDIIYFEYNEFSNVKKIGEGAFGIVNRADWKICGIKIALKILAKNSSINEDNMNKFLKELNNLRQVSYHPNINRFYGITKEPLSNNFAMVLQFANHGTLRQYLKSRFDLLGWKDKIQMALDITSGLNCLHSRNIIHRDLHAKNILVHNNNLMIADLGLSKQLTEATSHSIVYGMPAYIEPQCFKSNNYIRNKKSDIYSLGVLLWEVTSGRPPFPDIQVQALSFQIAMGLREQPIDDTPADYVNLYQKCWDDDPNLRPNIDDVSKALEKISLQFNSNCESDSEDKLDSDNETNPNLINQNEPNLSQINNQVSMSISASEFSIDNVEAYENESKIDKLTHQDESKLSQIDNQVSMSICEFSIDSVEAFTNSESESRISEDLNKLDINNDNLTNQNDSQSQSISTSSTSTTSTTTLKSSLSPIENQTSTPLSSVSSSVSEDERELSNDLKEIIEAYLKNIKIGWTKSFDFYNFLKKYESKSREIFKYLINNPTTQHYEVMVGKFYSKEFGTNKNNNLAFEWYKKAIQKNDVNGYFEIGLCYKCGAGAETNANKAFEFYRLAANNGLNVALFFLAYCYRNGDGVKRNDRVAFELYKKSAENGFIPSQYSLARCYKRGEGTQVNEIEALKWYKLYQEHDGKDDVSDEIKSIEIK